MRCAASELFCPSSRTSVGMSGGVAKILALPKSLPPSSGLGRNHQPRSSCTAELLREAILETSAFRVPAVSSCPSTNQERFTFKVSAISVKASGGHVRRPVNQWETKAGLRPSNDERSVGRSPRFLKPCRIRWPICWSRSLPIIPHQKNAPSGPIDADILPCILVTRKGPSWYTAINS
jgi:hypothetical protein